MPAWTAPAQAGNTDAGLDRGSARICFMDEAADSTQAHASLAPLARLLPEIGGIEVVNRLSSLSGSDFASVMLEVARRRSSRPPLPAAGPFHVWSTPISWRAVDRG
jgi:hypothetical protein